jgi:hypothetical protein
MLYAGTVKLGKTSYDCHDAYSLLPQLLKFGTFCHDRILKRDLFRRSSLKHLHISLALGDDGLPNEAHPARIGERDAKHCQRNE